MTDSRIPQVAALAQVGSLFDPALVSRLSNIGGEITAIKAKLNAAGMADLATSLNGFDANAISTLSSHIAAGQGALMSRLSTFASTAAISNTASIADAFGPVLRARGLMSSLDDIDTMLNDIDTPDLQALVSARVSQIQALPAQVTSLISAESAFFTQSSTLLANFMQSVEIVNMYQSMPLKAVLGAVVSDDLLTILNTLEPTPDDEQ